ncbi:hypothetical protein ACLEXX_02000 [Enterobacter ludwigii]|uniref:hypothetical protein n=1 Tax=Enterobacter ludwigii TaxID=299767 RepID=UPI0039751D57
MATLSLKFRVHESLSQQFKSAVATSYLHAALMNISHKEKDYTKQSKNKPVFVYVVVFNISKSPQSPVQMIGKLNRLFTITKIDNNHYYVE